MIKPNTKVYIAIPNHDGKILAKLAEWLVRTYNVYSKFISNLDILTGKPLENVSNDIIESFLKTDCTHLLWIDSDIVPDDQLFPRLLNHDVDVVGSAVLIYRDNFPCPLPCAAIKNDPTFEKQQILSLDQDMPIVEVDMVGFGCILIKKSVLKKLKPPYMFREWNQRGAMKKGMDAVFCDRVKKLGFKIHLDKSTLIDQYQTLSLLDQRMKMTR